MTLRTEYEFVLPRGYLDSSGTLHKQGTMRLATARDELEPLRDPFVTGPDDPRLTILVLARVVLSLGSVPLVTTREIEDLFAADLAYLQDFYGVINFGTPEEIDSLLAAQDEAVKATSARAQVEAAAGREPAAASGSAPASGAQPAAGERPSDTGPVNRRASIQEVPSGGR